MSTPDQHGDGGHKLPIANLPRSGVAKRLYDGLATIRREEGVDPRKYASVASDIRYDVQSTMYCADIVAQQTADLLRPAILSGHFPGRFRRIRVLLRHQLFAAAMIAAALAPIYQEIHATRQQAAAKREFENLIGRAILAASPAIQTSINDKRIAITISGNLLDGVPKTIELQHGRPPEEIERLRTQFESK